MPEDARFIELELIEDHVQIGGVVLQEIAAFGTSRSAMATEINLEEMKSVRKSVDDRPPRLPAATDAVQHDDRWCFLMWILGDHDRHTVGVDGSGDCCCSWDISHDRFLT